MNKPRIEMVMGTWRVKPGSVSTLRELAVANRLSHEMNHQQDCRGMHPERALFMDALRELGVDAKGL